MNKQVIVASRVFCESLYGTYTEDYQVVYSDDSQLTYDVLGGTGIYIKGGFSSIDECKEFACSWFGGK